MLAQLDCTHQPHMIMPQNTTLQVARHLAKLFDSMAKLKFQQDADGKPTKEALGMFSKDKDPEYVEFDKPCMCVGQVENWLNDLLDTMKATIRHEFTEAVVTYEEKPRDQWIFDPPAQVKCIRKVTMTKKRACYGLNVKYYCAITL